MVIHSGRPDARVSRDERDDLVLRPHRDAALGARAEMKSSLKSGRPLRPDVLNHVPSVPQISHPSPQVANHGNRLRRTRKMIGRITLRTSIVPSPRVHVLREDCQCHVRRVFFKLPSVSREAGFRVIRGESRGVCPHQILKHHVKHPQDDGGCARDIEGDSRTGHRPAALAAEADEPEKGEDKT